MLLKCEIPPRETSSLEVAAFLFWIPEKNFHKVKNFIVLVPGTNSDGREIVMDKEWQELAEETHCGLIGCAFLDKETEINGEKKRSADYCLAYQGSGPALLEAVASVALSIGRPDWLVSRFLIWGFSAGGQFSFNFARWCPWRTLAFVINKGGNYYNRNFVKEICKIPAIVFIGLKDDEWRNKNLNKVYSSYIERGAKWLKIEEDVAHEVGNSKIMSINFFRDVMKLYEKPIT